MKKKERFQQDYRKPLNTCCHEEWREGAKHDNLFTLEQDTEAVSYYSKRSDANKKKHIYLKCSSGRCRV